MVFKVFVMLVILKMASSLPDTNVNVNVDQNVKTGCGCSGGNACCKDEFCKGDNCFFLYASNQCFCAFNGTSGKTTWEEARQFCSHHHGMQLPHPTCGVALRSAVVQEYGNCDRLWLDAKTDAMLDVVSTTMMNLQFFMRWQDNGVEITKYNPLLLPENITVITGTPLPFGANQCLEMIATEEAMRDDPNHPYNIAECNSAGHAHILCEKVK